VGRLISVFNVLLGSLTGKWRPYRYLLSLIILLFSTLVLILCRPAIINAQSPAPEWSDGNYSVITVESHDQNPFVSISANPSYGGVVTARILYNDLAHVTVTATAHREYRFLYWTERGTVVSENPAYAFSTTTKRLLVANFVYEGEVPFRLMPGDVNGDNRITVQDVSLVMQYLLNLVHFTPEQKRAADVNGDGWIDVRDVTLIMQRALLLIDRF
jgi:hypothetical protein